MKKKFLALIGLVAVALAVVTSVAMASSANKPPSPCITRSCIALHRRAWVKWKACTPSASSSRRFLICNN